MTLRCSFRDLSELNRTLKQKEYFLINNKYCIFAIGALEFLKKKKKNILQISLIEMFLAKGQIGLI